MNKERLRKRHDTTPCPYLRKADRPFKGPSKGEGQSSYFREKMDFQNREEWKDVIPADVETSINPFQSTDEEVSLSWEDIPSDSVLYTSEEKDSSEETIDINTMRAEHSSPEIMRLEGSKFSEEIISPLEYPRKTIDFNESDLNFSPKLASTQVSFENSRDLDRSVHQSTKQGNFQEEDLNLSPKLASTQVESSFGNRRIFDRFFHRSTKLGKSLENENSLPSTIDAPNIFDFEEVQNGKDAVIETTPAGFKSVLNFFVKEVENPEKPFITTINTEDIVDSVFKHPDEPKSPDLDDALIAGGGSDEQHTLVTNERRSLNENYINTPQTGKINTRKFFLSNSSNLWFSRRRLTKGNRRENVSPRQLFIHSQLSSGELNTSIIRQSSRIGQGKLKVGKESDTHLFPPNPPKATNYSGVSNEDPYVLTSDESNLGAEIPIPRNQRENVSPRQLFIHSQLSSGELNTSIIRQSSRKSKGKLKVEKKNNTRLIPPNPPKATNYSGASNEDPYVLTNDESYLNAEIPIPSYSYTSVARNLKPRKETPAVKSRGRKKKSSRSSVKWVSLSKKKAQEHAEYLKTIPICPLSLQYSRCARTNEDISSEEI